MENIKTGVDDHLANGGSIDDYSDAPDKEMARAQKLHEKSKYNSLKVAQEIHDEHHIIFVGDSFYIWRENKLGGGVYSKLYDPEVEQYIMARLGKAVRAGKLTEILRFIKAGAFYHVDNFNRNTGELNLANGILNLAGNTLRQATHQFYTSVQLPATYRPGLESKLWTETVHSIFSGNQDDIALFQTFCGYALGHSTESDKFLCVVGSGANGKSVLAHGLISVFGRDNVSALSLSRLGDDKYTGMLYGKMMNITTESSSRASQWSENLKTAVSGEMMISDEKYKDRFHFTPFAKHIIFMNDHPYLEDKSIGVSRRMILIELTENFEDKKDEKLKAKLTDEREGIFNWCLEGYQRWLKDGFKLHEDAIERVRKLKIESDSVLQFAHEMGDLEDAFEQDMVYRADCYRVYHAFCKDTGQKPVRGAVFFKGLERYFGCDCYKKLLGTYYVTRFKYSETGLSWLGEVGKSGASGIKAHAPMPHDFGASGESGGECI